MSESLLQDLEFLYGPERAAQFWPRLESLMATYASQIPPSLASAGRARLSERDALLIVYPDQIQEPGTPPLSTLAHFLETHVTGRITGLHLLPFYPSSSDDGFAVMDYYQVEPTFGDWKDIGRFGRSFDLMFDAVFNHLSARSRWFQGFLRGSSGYEDFFIAVPGDPDLSAVIRPRALPLITEFPSARGPLRVWTTFSEDQIDLNFANPEVLLAIIQVLLFYVTHGAKYLRLDAIAFLWKQIGTCCLHLPQTHRVIKLLRAVLDVVAPRVLLITETNVPHADNLSYFGEGRDEAQLVYNFALPPLVLHSFATGNAEKLTRWAGSLQVPTSQVTFLNFLASHDGIGVNPAREILEPSEIQGLVDRTVRHGGYISWKALADGSRAPYELNINYFDALSDPAANEALEIQIARFLCAHALMLALPGVPALYFHSLFGSRGDRAGASDSGIWRRINREKLPRAKLTGELADPGSLRARVFDSLKRLLDARREHAAFGPDATAEVLVLSPSLFAIRRCRNGGGGTQILCLHNVSGNAVELRLKDQDGALSGDWRPIIQTDSTLVAGTGVLQLNPYATWWGCQAATGDKPAASP